MSFTLDNLAFGKTSGYLSLKFNLKKQLLLYAYFFFHGF